MNPSIEAAIRDTKEFRKQLDSTLQLLKSKSTRQIIDGKTTELPGCRTSSERAEARRKIQEAIMWLGMDLKAINEESPGAQPNPYPQSYNPESTKIEPTADGLKL